MKRDILPLWLMAGRGFEQPNNSEDFSYGFRITSRFGLGVLRTRILPEPGNNVA